MKINLLIVEDNRMELEVIMSDLEKSGFHCLVAESGRSALEIMDGTEVDLVLSDQYMPHMDGLELLNEIKSRYGSIPFIMLTGSGSVDSAVTSIKHGADDYIQKPYNLDELLATREDLFHRINVFPIILPPLRERIKDIPLLVDYFLDHFRKELGKPLPGITKKALDAIMKHSWPGNIRELKNCIERAAILTNNELIKPEYLSIGVYQTADVPLQERKEEMQPTIANTVDFNFSLLEKETSLDNIIEKAKAIVLEYCGNEKTRAAKLLKRDRNIFYRKK